MFYEFTFNNGVAIVQEAESKKQVAWQPHNPTGVSPEPWASEAEARAWAEGVYGFYLSAENDLAGEMIEEVVDEMTGETDSGDGETSVASEGDTDVIEGAADEQPAQGE